MGKDSTTRDELENALRDVLGPLGSGDTSDENAPGTTLLAGLGGLVAGFLYGRFRKRRRDRRKRRKS